MDSNTRVVVAQSLNPDGSNFGAAQAVEVLSGLAVKSNGDVKERSTVSASMSDRGAKIGAKNWDATVPLEPKGAGMDGSTVKAPDIQPFLLACAMAVKAGAMIKVTGVTGTFTRGEQLTNTTASNAVGTIAHVIDLDGSSKQIWVYDLQNMPADTESLTGDSSSATATISGTPDDALCYHPTSDRALHKMLRLNVHMDGIRRVVDKARGTFSLDFKSGEIAAMQFSIKGLYATPTDQPIPSVEYSDIEPLICENAGLTIAGYPTADNTIEKLIFQLGNTVSPVPDINSPNGRHSFRIAGKRKPNGSIDPEAIPLSEFNPFTHWENGDRVPIHATLGETAGERVSVVVTQAQFTGINDQSRADADVYDLSYRATGQNDNEFFLFFH